MVRSQEGEPAYAKSALMSVAYYGDNDEAGAPGPAQVETMMNALRYALVAGEARLGETAVNAPFSEKIG